MTSSILSTSCAVQGAAFQSLSTDPGISLIEVVIMCLCHLSMTLFLLISSTLYSLFLRTTQKNRHPTLTCSPYTLHNHANHKEPSRRTHPARMFNDLLLPTKEHECIHRSLCISYSFFYSYIILHSSWTSSSIHLNTSSSIHLELPSILILNFFIHSSWTSFFSHLKSIPLIPTDKLHEWMPALLSCIVAKRVATNETRRTSSLILKHIIDNYGTTYTTLTSRCMRTLCMGVVAGNLIPSVILFLNKMLCVFWVYFREEHC